MIGKKIVFELKIVDVFYFFWVLLFVGKMDINLDGIVNRFSFLVFNEGVYCGKCVEFCGRLYVFMEFKVKVVS